jgi:RNA polymerase sigma-70 factor (ECF subfamily)
MHTTPVSLLERLRSAVDQEAWARFVQLYTPLLYRWARAAGLRDEHDAADLIQDVLLTLTRRLPEYRYDPLKSFRAWLHTVLRTHWLNRLKARKYRPLGGAGVSVDELPDDDPVPALEEADYRRYLVGRILELLRADYPARTWRAFWAYVVEGQPAREVAARFGMTEGAVCAARIRVLHRLRQELEGLMD